MARHEALRLLRRQWSSVPLDNASSHQPGERPDEPITLVERIAGPVDVELASEARDALRALAGLRWRRRVLALKATGYKYEEIAEVLGLTYTNVNRHMTWGRAELRALREAA